VDGRLAGSDGINYTIPSDGTSFGTGNEWFKLVNGNVVLSDGADITSDPDAFRAWAESFGTLVDTKTGTGSDLDFTGLTFGYYFITTTTGSLVTVTSIAPDVTVQDKNGIPTIDKEIVAVNSDGTETLGSDGDNADDPGHGANEKAIAGVGDTVSYKLTVKAQPGAENYIVTDTLSAGLTAPGKDDVTVAATGLTSAGYSVDVTGQVITVTFTKAYLDTIDTETTITIEYDAVVNNAAVIGEEGNPNTVTLQYGHSPDSAGKPGTTTSDGSTVYVAQFSLTKSDGTNGLAGAGFVLMNSDGKYYKNDGSNNITWVDSSGQATMYTSGNDGKLNGTFRGLPNGTYTLVEKVVPDGYNALDPNDDSLKFTIEDTDYTNSNLMQSGVVVNHSGQELPSTGGIGTKIFYALGAVLVIGAGVVLVSRKRALD
jgi:fimbrial isopeptide formation D2 family protein/LPXTG-motif cell wall-anchored protein